MLSSPVLDLLRRARERLTHYPSSTLWLACCDAADVVGEQGQLALDELAKDYDALSSDQQKAFHLQGTDGVEAADAILTAQGTTIPAPPPTVETPAPVDEEALMVAAFCLGEAWEQMERARKLLGAKGEPKLPALQKELTAFTEELSKTLEERPLKEVA
jgi:hypothetical protein